MKKMLLGTTALIAGGLFAGSVMAADLEPAPLPAPVDEGFEVTVSGTAFGGFFYSSSNRTSGQTLVPWLSEIWFTATTTLANGIQVGVRVELEGVTVANQIDEHYIWLQGNFGRFQIGSDDAVSEKLSVAGPGYGAIGLDAPDFNTVAPTSTIDGVATDISGDNNKLSYITPRISGFQAGVSFAPNNAAAAGGSQVTLKAAGSDKNIFSAAANFENEFNGISVGFGAGIETGKRLGGVGGRHTAWNAGAVFGMSGFEIGGNYSEDNNAGGATPTDRSWQVSAAYGTGPWTIGVGFLQAKNTNAKYRRIGGGATYALGEGITLTADVNYEKETGLTPGKGVIAGVGIATAF